MAETSDSRTRRPSLSPGLRAGLGLVALLLAASLLALAADFGHWRTARADEADIRAMLVRVRLLTITLLEAESGTRGYLLTGQADDLKPYVAAQGQVPALTAMLAQDTKRFPNLSPDTAALATAAGFGLHTLDSAIAVSRGPGGAAAAAALVEQGEGRRALDATPVLADAVRKQVDRLRARVRNTELRWRLISEGTVALLAGAACIVLGTGLLGRVRAERLVQSRLEALMASVPAGIAIFDRALVCTCANPAFDTLAGSSGACLGETLWAQMRHDRAVLEPPCRKVLDRGEQIDGLTLSRSAAGAVPRDWVVSLYPVPTSEGGIGGVGLVAVEVTAQRAAERRLAFQLQLEERLRELGDPMRMKQTGCALIGQRLGVAHAAYGEVDASGSFVMVEGSWTDGRVAEAPGTRRLVDYGAPLAAALALDGRVSVADVWLDPRLVEGPARSFLTARRIAAFACVAVARGGRHVANLMVSDAAPRRWSEADMDLLQDAAERSWSAVERGRAAMTLQASQQHFERAVGGAGFGIWDWDLERNEVKFSHGVAPPFHEQMNGRICTAATFLHTIHPGDRARMAEAMAAVPEKAQSNERFFYEADYRLVKASGETHWMRSTGRVTLRAPDGRALRLSGVTRDITDRRLAEDGLAAAQDRLRLLNQDLEAQVRIEVEAREQAQSRLAQAQRMEALSQLSAGMAHDFNNVLQAITGSLALVQRRAGDAEVVRQLATMAGDAAARGGVLTARLLSFARQGELKSLPVQPASLLQGLGDMIDHMLGAGIEVRVDAPENVPALLADKGQLEAVLVNLALNARDAMPAGGVLTISAALDMVSQDESVPGEAAVGRFVRLSMTDTGIGMVPAVLARAGEPFFTTKPAGQGTGLGLSMARGFAEQSGGLMRLSSVAGEGTTVSMWLPLAVAEESAGWPGEEETPAPPGPLTRVLLVDDDALVREVLAGQIEDMGYSVALAQSGAVALARLDAGEALNLMITDYGMPGMNGAVLVQEARRRRPDLPILLLTGFADASLQVNTDEWDGAITLLLRKPVSSDALAKAASAVLQAAQPVGAAMVEGE